MAREPFNRTWNEVPDAPDQFAEPINAVWEEGWRGGPTEEPPKAEYQNWWQRRLDVNFQQVERNGALEWLDNVPYQSNAITIAASGDMYASQSDANEGNDPINDNGTNWLQIKFGKATESIFGFFRKATQTEVNNGSSDDGAVTPQKLRFGFAVSLGNNGYVKLPSWMSGIVFQWGRQNYVDFGDERNVDITFNIPFPNNVVFFSPTADTDQARLILTQRILTNNSVRVVLKELDTTIAAGVIFWFAVGY